MNDSIRLSFSPDQICALNNALRREIESQERLRNDAARIGVEEYIRHLHSALGVVAAGWDMMVK